MNLRSRRTDDLDINITPLIDVVFLLLIFFMVSTSFIKESQIKLDLPQASSTEVPEDQNTIKVAIDARGQYFVNDKALINNQEATLAKAIKQAAGEKKNPTIVINADANTTHQSVVSVLDVAKRLNYLRITFATERRKEGK